jgi:streptomycin 6-kinase
VIEVPAVVRRKAVAAGAGAWLDALPELVAELERDWDLFVGATLEGATEAFVAEVQLPDGTQAVLKLIVPRTGGAPANEIQALRLADGEGCVRLLREDEPRSALLLERLGRPLSALGVPLRQRHEILCATASRMWRPILDSGLPTGADKGRWLADFIEEKWEALGRPCSERTFRHALECAARRVDAHDDERAVLVHGDVHQWNALERDDGFALVDPDGLFAEAEYDLGILMREDPLDSLGNEPRERAQWLAELSGLDATAIWEWGVVERVSTGLLCTEIDLQPIGRQMLVVADEVAAR